MSILDLSKTLMDEFHHGYMKKKYGQKCELLFTDRLRTAFVMRFIIEFFKDIQKDVSAGFDTSNFEKNHEGFSKKNRKVIGMMKSESGQKSISEFVGLIAKHKVALASADDKRIVCKDNIHTFSYWFGKTISIKGLFLISAKSLEVWERDLKFESETRDLKSSQRLGTWNSSRRPKTWKLQNQDSFKQWKCAEKQMDLHCLELCLTTLKNK